MAIQLKSPYRYFGGKSAVASDIWQRFGNVPSYIEPFFGSGAVLLSRPHTPDMELVNDIDGMIVNFWRAVQADAEGVTSYADNPPFESDMHARHAWLVGRKASLQERLEGDPDYYDAKIAGWWVWGMSLWLGSGFCSGRGAWIVEDEKLIRVSVGNGVTRQMPLVVDRGIRSAFASHNLLAYFRELQARLSQVRVMCGDWSRVVTSVVLEAKTPTAVLLDPPYTHDERESGVYTNDDKHLYAAVREWAIANGNNPDLRIAYCGYADDFVWPDGWTRFTWKTNGGYSNQGETRNNNRLRETIYFSPHCLEGAGQLSLFAESEGR